MELVIQYKQSTIIPALSNLETAVIYIYVHEHRKQMRPEEYIAIQCDTLLDPKFRDLVWSRMLYETFRRYHLSCMKLPTHYIWSW